MIIIAHFFLEWKNVSGKNCREFGSSHFMFSNSPPPPPPHPVHTRRICNTYWFSTVRMVTWTRVNVTLSDNKVCELIAVKVLHTSLLNTTVVAFKVLPLGSYAPMPAPSPPFKTILELILWNGLQSCHCVTPDVISVIKVPSFQYFLHIREQKKSLGLIPVNLR